MHKTAKLPYHSEGCRRTQSVKSGELPLSDATVGSSWGSRQHAVGLSAYKAEPASADAPPARRSGLPDGAGQCRGSLNVLT